MSDDDVEVEEIRQWIKDNVGLEIEPHPFWGLYIGKLPQTEEERRAVFVEQALAFRRQQRAIWELSVTAYLSLDLYERRFAADRVRDRDALEMRLGLPAATRRARARIRSRSCQQWFRRSSYSKSRKRRVPTTYAPRHRSR